MIFILYIRRSVLYISDILYKYAILNEWSQMFDIHVVKVLIKVFFGGGGYPTKELLPKYSMQMLSVLFLKENKGTKPREG